MRTYNNSIVVQFDTTANGNSGSGKLITVFDVGTFDKADLFNSLLVPIANPVQADDSGNYSFTINDGTYDLYIDFGLPTQTAILKEQISNTVNNPPLSPDDVVSAFGLLSEAVAETNILKAFSGSAASLKERTLGDDNGGMWDYVLASTVTPNGFNIVQCVGINTLALVLRLDDGPIHASSWGLVGGIDETIGLQLIMSAMMDSDLAVVLEPKIYITTQPIITEPTASVNINVSCEIGRATIQVGLITEDPLLNIGRLISTIKCLSFEWKAVNLDLKKNCAEGMHVRNNDDAARDVEISRNKITGCKETGQETSAVAINVIGSFDNINIEKNNITSVGRETLLVSPVGCIGIATQQTKGIVRIIGNRVANVGSPVGLQDADGILVSGAVDILNSDVDSGSVLIEDNELIDCKGRGVKSQHTNTTENNNTMTISDDFRTILNWRYIDNQKSNGIVTGNTCDYGANVLNDAGGITSGAFARFSSMKDLPSKSSICSGNILITKTKFAYCVMSEIGNGIITLKVHDNDFGEHGVTVLHTGQQGDFVEAYYHLNNNTIELGGSFFDVADAESSFNNFNISVVDNNNIDTATGNFRQVFPLGGTFGLESNFTVGRNARLIERVEWIFTFDRLTNGNAFQTGDQLNSGRPFTGEGSIIVEALSQVAIPADALTRWQRVSSNPNTDSYSTWRSVTYT